MDGPRLTDLCEWLTARLGDRTLTRFQLMDMATVLVLGRHALEASPPRREAGRSA